MFTRQLTHKTLNGNLRKRLKGQLLEKNALFLKPKELIDSAIVSARSYFTATHTILHVPHRAAAVCGCVITYCKYFNFKPFLVG